MNVYAIAEKIMGKEAHTKLHAEGLMVVPCEMFWQLAEWVGNKALNQHVSDHQEPCQKEEQ